MAAQEPPKELVCPQCFEFNPAGAPFCQECGAPLSNAPAAEGSDQAVYKDLAQANLLRMRGQHKQAGEACLAILKRYPNNSTAHALLGDIYAETNDLDQAIQWYELALDLHDDEAVRAKLRKVQEQKEAAEHKASVADLGLPEKQPKTGLYAGLMILAIVVIGGAAFFAGRQMSGGTTAEKPTLSGGSISLSPDNGNEPAQPEGDGSAAGTLLAPQDREMTDALRAASALGQNILYVFAVPRGPAANITAHHASGFSLQQTAAQAAIDGLNAFPNCVYVTVRVVSNNQVSYVADVTRATLLQLQLPAAGETVTDELAAQMLQNVWPPETTPPAVPNETGTTGGVQTTGSNDQDQLQVTPPTTTTDPGGE